MGLSARNQFVGTVTAVEPGEVDGLVTVDVQGIPIKANITTEAMCQLGLRVGSDVAVLIKASHVIFSRDDVRSRISARNHIFGTLRALKKGATCGRLYLFVPNGLEIQGYVSNEMIDDAELVEGASAWALVKSTDVMVMSL
jgi:molybdate transport system regulatory protein